MKDFEPLSSQDKNVESANHAVIKQKQLSGRLVVKPGQTVFEFDLKTEECRVAELGKPQAHMNTQQDAIIKSAVTIRTEVMRKPDHLYVAALNKVNARRKFEKEIARMVKAGILIKTD